MKKSIGNTIGLAGIVAALAVPTGAQAQDYTVLDAPQEYEQLCQNRDCKNVKVHELEYKVSQGIMQVYENGKLQMTKAIKDRSEEFELKILYNASGPVGVAFPGEKTEYFCDILKLPSGMMIAAGAEDKPVTETYSFAHELLADYYATNLEKTHSDMSKSLGNIADKMQKAQEAYNSVVK